MGIEALSRTDAQPDSQGASALRHETGTSDALGSLVMHAVT